MLKLLLISAFLAAAEAFAAVGARPMMRAMRAPAPQAMLAPEVVSQALEVPTTTLVADNTLLLASGGLIGLFIPLAVVAIIVINFGIMKK